MGSLRALWRKRQRASSAGVVVLLALAVAVAATVFNLLDAALLRLPDLPAAGQLTAVGTVHRFYSGAASLAEFDAWQRAGIAGVQLGIEQNDRTLARRDDYLGLVQAIGVSAGMLPILGVRPALGRGFAADDEQASSAAVVVISRALFNAALGADRALIGHTYLQLNGIACRVVGVMPEHFHVPLTDPSAILPELWMPLATYARIDGDTLGPDMEGLVLMRLAPGVNRAAVEARLSAIALAQARAQGDRSILGVRIQSLAQAESSGVEPQLRLLGAGAAAVLLLGFLNAACLLGAAGLERREERAIRLALGASPGRLRAQAAAGGAVLGLAGGLAGSALAALGSHAVGTLAAYYLPRPESAAPSLGVLLAMTAAAAALGAAAGAASGGAKMAHIGAGMFRLRILAVAEISLSVALAAAAALVAVSYVRLVTLPRGYSTRGVVYTLMMEPQHHGKGADTPASLAALVNRTLSELRQQPALGAVAVSSGAPRVADAYTSAVAGWGPVPQPSRQLEAWFVTPGFFDVLQIPVLEGNLAAFHIGNPAVAVDRAMAMRLFGTQHAVGRRLSYMASGKERHATVAAVVGDIRETYGLTTVAGVEERPHLYLANPDFLGYLTLLGRARSSTGAGLHAIAQVSTGLETFATTQGLGALSGRSSHAQQRFQFLLALVFALLAIAIGLTGVLAFTARRVAARRREWAIRLALGEDPPGVFTRVLRDAAGLGLMGAGAGTVAALWAGSAIRALLFEVSPADPRILLAVAAAIWLAATLAAVTPALRAARTDPLELLRDS